MIIVAGGDSFVWGTELADCTYTVYSQSTFPALLSNSQGLNYQCVARPGNANDAITRMVIDKCENIIDDMAVVVAWSFVTRYEFKFTYSIDSPISPWCSINLHRNKFQIDRFSEEFFKHVGTNPDYQKYNTLRSIILLQTYLEKKNIPYLFLPTDSHFYVDHGEGVDSIVKTLFDLINWDNWYFFPSATESWNTTSPRGFYQWAVESKYSIGSDQHPLEKAHQDAAQLIQGKFNELVKKSPQSN